MKKGPAGPWLTSWLLTLIHQDQVVCAIGGGGGKVTAVALGHSDSVIDAIAICIRCIVEPGLGHGHLVTLTISDRIPNVAIAGLADRGDVIVSTRGNADCIVAIALLGQGHQGVATILTSIGNVIIAGLGHLGGVAVPDLISVCVVAVTGLGHRLP